MNAEAFMFVSLLFIEKYSSAISYFIIKQIIVNNANMKYYDILQMQTHNIILSFKHEGLFHSRIIREPSRCAMSEEISVFISTTNNKGKF